MNTAPLPLQSLASKQSSTREAVFVLRGDDCFQRKMPRHTSSIKVCNSISSVGVRGSLRDCLSTSALLWTVDSFCSLKPLISNLRGPLLTAPLHNLFNKAHFLTLLKQPNLTSKDKRGEKKKKSSLPTHLKVSCCKKKPISAGRKISCSLFNKCFCWYRGRLKAVNYARGVHWVKRNNRQLKCCAQCVWCKIYLFL